MLSRGIYFTCCSLVAVPHKVITEYRDASPVLDNKPPLALNQSVEIFHRGKKITGSKTTQHYSESHPSSTTSLDVRFAAWSCLQPR